MSIFGPKLWVHPFGKMSIFRLLEQLVFIAQNGVFFALQYRQRHFPGLYCLKKKLEKWSLLEQNHGLTSLEKCQFFNFWNFLFLQLRKVFFRSRISSKTFSWAILPLEKKCQSFDFLKILFLQLKETVFSSRRWSKTFCRPILPKKRRVAKTVIFGPKPWVNPFGKMSIFLLFELHVFIAQKSVFSIQNIVKDIFLDYIAYKKKSWKNGHFWTKTMR